MPPEETLDLLGVVTLSDEVIHVHPSSQTEEEEAQRERCPSSRIYYRNTVEDQRPGRRSNRGCRGWCAPQSERRAHADAAAKSTEAGGPSSKDSSVAPPASRKFIRFKHPSSLLIGGGGEQLPAAGSLLGNDHSSYHANNHTAATLSSSSRLTREPAALTSHQLPKARWPPSAFVHSGIVPPESDVDAKCFLQGVAAFGSLDIAAQLAEVKKFTGVGQLPQPLPVPEGGGFTFWLTPEQADADLAWVYGKVSARKKEPASGSGRRR